MVEQLRSSCLDRNRNFLYQLFSPALGAGGSPTSCDMSLVGLLRGSVPLLVHPTIEAAAFDGNRGIFGNLPPRYWSVVRPEASKSLCLPERVGRGNPDLRQSGIVSRLRGHRRDS